MKVLVTGATGFVGSAVVARLAADRSHDVVAAVRRPDVGEVKGVSTGIVGDLGPTTDWRSVLPGVDTVIHCAARVHVMREVARDPLAEFRRANVEGTLALARQAAEAGVRRFIFISSIKVNGESTTAGHPFTAATPPAPRDPYGVSKMEAETELRAVGSATGLETVIIRPVLVYGPGVKGNFRSMLGWLDRAVPLPLGAIHNRRSLVALDNLVDLVVRCIDHPRAANRTFLVSDGEDLSTTELLRRAARALGRSPRLVPVPASLIGLAGRMLGRSAAVQRLTGSLQVDIAATRTTLDWSPPISVDEGLRRAATDFRRSAAR